MLCCEGCWTVGVHKNNSFSSTNYLTVLIFRFKDYSDALTHTLNAHCDGANQTYPCPFCQRIVTSEHELNEHIDSHTNQKEVSCNDEDRQCVYAQIERTL